MSADAWANRVMNGDRAALSRAITLFESARSDDRLLADKILDHCMPKTGQALRLAVTGAPGVGKSTLIEALGQRSIAHGGSVAVLAVDPSSWRTGGSILGDKTRMPVLSVHDQAYVRPSPSAGSVGGIRRATHGAMLLCEAAGFDVVMIETVGAGQSEFAARHIVDIVLVLVLPNAGDELQGIKQGILEAADLVAVTKADQEAEDAAQLTLRQFRRALAASPARPKGIPVLACSAVTGSGIAGLWKSVKECEAARKRSGELKQNRNSQIKNIILEDSKTDLLDKLVKYCSEDPHLNKLQSDVIAGHISVRTATRTLVSRFLGTIDDKVE